MTHRSRTREAYITAVLFLNIEVGTSSQAMKMDSHFSLFLARSDDEKIIQRQQNALKLPVLFHTPINIFTLLNYHCLENFVFFFVTPSTVLRAHNNNNKRAHSKRNPNIHTYTYTLQYVHIRTYIYIRRYRHVYRYR